MLTAFSSAMLVDKSSWIPLACMAAVLFFVLFENRLLKEMVISTYGKGISDKNMKGWMQDINNNKKKKTNVFKSNPYYYDSDYVYD
ncbi:unnamed protein product [Cochlearia groenlandica]